MNRQTISSQAARFSLRSRSLKEDATPPIRASCFVFVFLGVFYENAPPVKREFIPSSSY
jgi:hypothetical protein